MQEITIKTDFIKLQQFIKLAGVVSQGSDAKMLILDGIVKVNEEICLERGKKIRNGDIVEVKNFGTFKAIAIGE